MQNGDGGWSLQGPDPCVAGAVEADPKAGGEAGVVSDDKEGRSEGSGDDGRARETEGSGGAVQRPCRQRRASMAGRELQGHGGASVFPGIEKRNRRGFRQKKNRGRRMAGLIHMPYDLKVHITQGNHDDIAMIISWVTTVEPGSSTVLYGTSEDNLDCSAKGNHSQYTFYKYTSGYIHHCTIKKLKFDTKYYYAVGTEEMLRKF